MSEQLMEYNSSREKLIIPEYGRNVQKLVLHAKTIEDDDERQRYIERIVELVYQMNPQSKNVLEYRERLWAHIFRIADYDLNVTPPNGIMPTPENAKIKLEKIDYPGFNNKNRHYGNNVKKLLKKATEMEDGAKKDAFIELIASFMKTAYRNWHREHFINDEVIKSDISKMTNGAIELGEDFKLVSIHATSSPPKNTGKRTHGGRGRSNSNNKSRSNSRHGRSNSNNNRRRR